MEGACYSHRAEVPHRHSYISYNDTHPIYKKCQDHRLSKLNSLLAGALSALNPESTTFLDVSGVKHIMDLSRVNVIETEFKVAEQSFSLQKQSELTGVLHIASTAMCKNSFCTLRNVFSCNASQKKGPVGSAGL